MGDRRRQGVVLPKLGSKSLKNEIAHDLCEQEMKGRPQTHPQIAWKKEFSPSMEMFFFTGEEGSGYTSAISGRWSPRFLLKQCT